jgi:hypothetical protein
LSVQRTFFGGSKDVFLSFEAKSAPVLKRTLSPKVLKHFQCYQISLNKIRHFVPKFAIFWQISPFHSNFHNMHHFCLNFATFSVPSREFGTYHGILLSTLIQSSPAKHICIIITRRMLRYAPRFYGKKIPIFFLFLYFEIPHPIWGLPAKIWGSRPAGLAVKGITSC